MNIANSFNGNARLCIILYLLFQALAVHGAPPLNLQKTLVNTQRDYEKGNIIAIKVSEKNTFPANFVSSCYTDVNLRKTFIAIFSQKKSAVFLTNVEDNELLIMTLIGYRGALKYEFISYSHQVGKKKYSK